MGALHPAFRWAYFENGWKDNMDWVAKAKQMVREVWETQYRTLKIVSSSVTDEPVAKRQRKYYNPFQAYCERARSVSGCSVVKEEMPSLDRIKDVDELELWQSSWEDGVIEDLDVMLLPVKKSSGDEFGGSIMGKDGLEDKEAGEQAYL